MHGKSAAFQSIDCSVDRGACMQGTRIMITTLLDGDIRPFPDIIVTQFIILHEALFIR